VIATVIGVAIGLFAWLFPRGNPAVAPPTVPGIAPARFDVVEAGDHMVFVAPVPESRLPVPPPYPPDQYGNHCAEWLDWFAQLKAAGQGEGPDVVISAPAAAPVNLIGARVTVYDTIQLDQATLIACQHGAGGNPGTKGLVDLDHPEAPLRIVDELGSGTELPLGANTFTVDAGTSEALSIVAEGSPGVIYEWSIELTVVIDAQRTTRTFGDREHPIRSYFGPYDLPSRDYDQDARAWVDPFAQ
jgi:hypothetical protein